MKKKILILGCSGILGNTLYRTLSKDKTLKVYGTFRNKRCKEFFKSNLINNLIELEDVNNFVELKKIIIKIEPEVVINAISVPSDQFSDFNTMLNIFSLLPKMLNVISHLYGFKLIQISSDGVFSGLKGQYKETDLPDAKDKYGKCKILGEVFDPNCLTLRTSIIGPDLYEKNGLLSWFLKQEKSCSGFKNVIFSGFPTIIFAEIIRDFILPFKDFHGLYHVSSNAISKYKLLTIISSIYNKEINIEAKEEPICNRSLNSNRFLSKTNYEIKNWNFMIKKMFMDHKEILKK